MGETPVSQMLINGDSITMKNMGKEVPVTDEMRKAVKDELDIFPELNYGNPGYQLSLQGITSIDGNDAYVMKITDPDGNTSTNYYDVQSGLKVKQEAERPSTQGKTNTVLTYGDYKEVDGIEFPYTIGTEIGNGMTIDLKVKEIKVNSGLSDSDFK